jgi:hypothetical protein
MKGHGLHFGNDLPVKLAAPEAWQSLFHEIVSL